MHRIAVVGEKDSIYGFAALGLEIFSVKNSHEAKSTVKRLINENVAIVYLTESIIADIYHELAELTADSFVSAIPIPGLLGETKIGVESLKKAVIKAVGTDILFS